MRKVVVGVALALCFAPSARAATASTRILYMADWTGHTEVVVLVPNELRIYAPSGGLRRSWPLPSASVGRDCSYYSEPQCVETAELKLQDATGALAAYVFHGEVHVLRLEDGRDSIVGQGSEARFMDDGLVYADGARVRVIPWVSLW
jgi:hypothetical protein